MMPKDTVMGQKRGSDRQQLFFLQARAVPVLGIVKTVHMNCSVLMEIFEDCGQ